MKGRMKQIEREYGEPLETLIPRLLTKHGSVEPVAKLLNIHYNALYRWCKKAGIERRIVFEIPTVSEAIPTVSEAIPEAEHAS